MKRLLSISFDLALLSFIPILSWFILGLYVDKNLINVFTLTYPIQFVWYIMKSIFATGANISKEKDKNNNAVMSAMVLGIIVGFIIFGLIALNIDSYIELMNMDATIYREFAIYSIVLLYIQLVLALVLEKLYYEEKNRLANEYSIVFNLLNIAMLLVSSSLFNNKNYIIIATLIPLVLYTFVIVIKILNCIKYDSVELFNNIAFFLIFLFGLSNVMEYGEKYIFALTFVALITDTQWDVFDAVSVTSKIDISKREFNYKEHKKNAYKLLFILLSSVFIMFICLFSFYNLNLKITFIFLTFELINFIIYPIYKIKTNYLQLEYSAIKTTVNKIVPSSFRMIFSFLKTPFCTGLGQIFSSFYQFITVNIMFHKNFKINNSGYIKRKGLNSQS